MLRIRLRRVGAKGRPMYRIVVADSRSPRDGRFVEVIGFYNPLADPAVIEIAEDRLVYWRSVGAQCSESVESLLATLDRRQAPAETSEAEPAVTPPAAEDTSSIEDVEEEETEEAAEVEES